MNANIGKLIAKGALWTVLMRMSIRVLGIISILILARILTPEDYGLVAKAVLVGSFLDLLTQFGLNAALIKNQNANKSHYDTVWTINIVRNLSLGVILMLAAPHIAYYFNDSRIEPLIYCYSLATIVAGFENVGVVDFQKYMKFDKDFKFNFIKKITSFSITIFVAVIWRTYWAFPIGVLAGKLMGVVVSYFNNDFRPTITFKEFSSIFRFSKWMFLYELISAVSLKLDGFLLSKFGETKDLGLYTISYEVSGIPSTEIAMPVARAALPGLSKLNHNIVEFQKMYSNILATVLLVAIPTSVGLSLVAKEFTLVFLGEKWLGVAPIISILAFFGISRVVSASAVTGLIAFDRPELLGKQSFFMLIIKLILLPPATIYFGYLGLAYGVTVSGFLGIIILLLIQHYIGMLNIKLFLSQIWRVVLSSCVMAWGVQFAFTYWYAHSDYSIYTLLLIKVLSGALLFLASLTLLCSMTNCKNGPEEKIFSQIRKKIGSR
ncbi:lipopolysaccharide biosynthesis protein [Thalassotalea sp. M1531]|uniref:Lipopolysaccharide biosynthesis protein n=1 Tax=Thalassotalea algicola TaxID=2716224 RepID=A0A7Y0LF60_9GAMM|nr:lipopolysaccharide biosynthesis protein [Thalassotalea algicola]NMP33059.1 lipopolysaccharide biosynthesis protein [Thalassotalea algicola]